MIKTVLVDQRNYAEVMPELITSMTSAVMVGLDTETHGKNAHEGIKEFRKSKEMKASDYRRIAITGLSLYPEIGASEEEAVAYYFNLNHSDVENRLTWEQVKTVLDLKPSDTAWIAHNAVYELTVLQSAYNYKPQPIICTLQMAVSAWGPDEYPVEDYINAALGPMVELFPDAERLFRTYDAKAGKDSLTPQQNELLAKVLGKQSSSSFSYNGVVQSISYGYGLKKLVKKFFGYQMQTFDETLEDGDAEHMGELTGEQVAYYGAEDAYWAVRLYYRIYQYLMENSPDVITTFFEQENPMVDVFANLRLEGMKVNQPAIHSRRELERANFAQALRDLKGLARQLLPFEAQLNNKLAQYDKWYADKGVTYRDKFLSWVNTPDSDDDFVQCCQVSSPVSNAWAGNKCSGISICHYYMARIMMYDLIQANPILYKGKVQSDGEARGHLKEKLQALDTDRARLGVQLVTKMGEMASIEQRMKLYLTPYMLLTDPETGKMYPEVSSMLATRRMASSNPNPMQLAKRGESTYVRGFYEPDELNEVLMSLDWSQVELVLVGEMSGDPEFAKAYGQLPYQDLHVGSSVSCLNVLIPELTEEQFKHLKHMSEEEAKLLNPKLITNVKGELMTPAKAYKYWRTELGKKANFGYWYSGALSDVGESMGWTSEQMWKAVDAYRQRFAVAEAWRTGVIEQVKETGFVTLPDGHRRVRFEATTDWAIHTNNIFLMYANQGLHGIHKFGQHVMAGVQRRSGNQAVNALIQGTCATLAKRSILAINKAVKEAGLRARFKMPIHDELLFSVHKDDAVEFRKLAKRLMTTHPTIINKLKAHCTASVGLTFEPFDAKKAPIGQIELDEAPNILGFTPDSVLSDDELKVAIDYLFTTRSTM